MVYLAEHSIWSVLPKKICRYKVGIADVDELNKKLSYRLGTARRERLPKIAEMDREMTTQAEMTFKCTSRSSKVAPIES